MALPVNKPTVSRTTGPAPTPVTPAPAKTLGRVAAPMGTVPPAKSLGRVDAPFVPSRTLVMPTTTAVQSTTARQIQSAAIQAANTVQNRSVQKPAGSYSTGTMTGGPYVPGAPAVSPASAPIPPSLLDPGYINAPTGAPVTDYSVPYADVDKPYVPPPSTYDAPGQYDSSMSAKPAIKNASTALAKATVAAAIAPPAVKLSWFDTFLSWIGLARNKTVQAKMAGEAANAAVMSRTDTAYSLVRRARNGDQVAMAVMATIRDKAAEGDKQAEVALRLMHAYIEAHPTDENADMGGEFDGEFDGEVNQVAAQLSHGPILTKHILSRLTRPMTSIQRAAFHHGMTGGTIGAEHEPSIKAAHKLGKATGLARIFQASRMRHIPLSRVNPDVGWELGD